MVRAQLWHAPLVNFLDQYSLDQIKAAILAHFSETNQQSPIPLVQMMHAALVKLEGPVGDKKRQAWESEFKREAFAYATSQSDFGSPSLSSDTTMLLAATWGMISEGLLIPSHRSDHANQPRVHMFLFLTPKGKRLLSDGPDDPLHPGFSEKFRGIVKDDESVARIEDAAQCLSRGLLRPAVVMLGLAVETTVSILHRGLYEHQNAILRPSRMAMAKELIEAIEKYVRGLPNSGNKPKKEGLQRAIMVAHDLREDRNSCSHPGGVPLHKGDVEDLFRGASRAIMKFWEHGISEFWENFSKGPYPH